MEVWILRDGHKPVAVIEREVPAFVPGRAIRAPGLWLSITEESAGHWSIGFEAFGLKLDDPADVVGVPIPVGLDLEWEDDPDPSSCLVTGEVLVGDEVLAVSGRGSRT